MVSTETVRRNKYTRILFKSIGFCDKVRKGTKNVLIKFMTNKIKYLLKSAQRKTSVTWAASLIPTCDALRLHYATASLCLLREIRFSMYLNFIQRLHLVNCKKYYLLGIELFHSKN